MPVCWYLQDQCLEPHTVVLLIPTVGSQVEDS
jgi:hypothetical protein